MSLIRETSIVLEQFQIIVAALSQESDGQRITRLWPFFLAVPDGHRICYHVRDDNRKRYPHFLEEVVCIQTGKRRLCLYRLKRLPFATLIGRR